MLNQRYRCGDEVTAEVINGEAVIINLTTGIYYSLEGVGGQIWSLVDAGYSVDEIASAVASAYGTPVEGARAHVSALVAELVAEAVVVAVEDDAPRRDEPALTPLFAYEAPKLVAYRDMGDLLALDPPAPGLTDIAWKAPKE
jgi:hypothetical protein